MVAPAIGAVAAKGFLQGKKGSLLKKFLSSLRKEGGEKPYVLSTEGIIMMLLALFIEITNIILAILDIFFGIGTPIAVYVNIPPMILVGGWLWIRTGKLPIKKGGLPFLLNVIPFARFYPFWLHSVWTSLEKRAKSSSDDEDEE